MNRKSINNKIRSAARYGLCRAKFDSVSLEINNNLQRFDYDLSCSNFMISYSSQYTKSKYKSILCKQKIKFKQQISTMNGRS
jgi:hypothetical protein